MKGFLRVLLVLVLSVFIALGSFTVAFSQQKIAPGQYAIIAEWQKASGRRITRFGEAPQLAELVKQGKLPPVEKRLPEEPAVIEPIEEIGRYGGTIEGPWTGEYAEYVRITYFSNTRGRMVTLHSLYILMKKTLERGGEN